MLWLTWCETLFLSATDPLGLIFHSDSDSGVWCHINVIESCGSAGFGSCHPAKVVKRDVSKVLESTEYKPKH